MAMKAKCFIDTKLEQVEISDKSTVEKEFYRWIIRVYEADTEVWLLQATSWYRELVDCQVQMYDICERLGLSFSGQPEFIRKNKGGPV